MLEGATVESQASPAPVATSTLIAALNAEDWLERRRAQAHLAARLKARTLSLDELLDIAVREGDLAVLVDDARMLLQEMGVKAAPLLPRLVELLAKPRDPEADFHPAYWLLQTAAGVNPELAFLAPPHPTVATTDSRAIARALLPRVRELLLGQMGPPTRRVALLPIIECLGAEAGHLAPLMLDWIREIKRERMEYYREHPNHFVRWSRQPEAIARALTGMGPRGMQELVAGIQSEDDLVAYELRRALEDPSPLALEEFRVLVRHADNGLRLRAVRGLGVLVRGKPELIDDLRALMKDPTPGVRRAAIAELYDLQEAAVPSLRHALEDSDVGVRVAAAAALRWSGEGALPALPRLIELAASKHREERLASLEALTGMGAKGRDAIPLAFDALLAEFRAEPDQPPDGRCVDALGAFGPRAVAHLVSAAANSSGVRLEAAVHALIELRPLPAQLRDLVGKYAPLEGLMRIRMAGLSARGGDARAVTVLLDGLRNDDHETRAAAVRATTVAGASARSALPLLVEGIRALSRAGPEEAWESERARETYVRAVAAVGVGAIDGLLLLLGDPEKHVRDAAAFALVLAEHRGSAAIEDAWASLEFGAKACVVKAVSKYVLGYTRHRKKPWPLWLAARLADPTPAVRLEAARAYASSYRTPEEVAARVHRAVIDLLTNKDQDLARGAADALKGCYGDESLASFEQELRDLEPRLDGHAREAVRYVLPALGTK